MKRTIKFSKIALTVLCILGTTNSKRGLADETNQCLVARKKTQVKPTPSEAGAIEECVKKKTCGHEQFQKMCPWAIEQKKNRVPDLEKRDPDDIDNISTQCEQVAIIACSLDLKSAQSRITLFSDFFLSEKNAESPLIFNFENPGIKVNNLNIRANLAKLESDRSNYQVELENLSNELRKLSDTVKTESAVQANLKKANSLIDAFEKKWTIYFKNIDSMKELIYRAGAVIFDWHSRIVVLEEDPYCMGIKAEVDAAEKDSSELLRTFQNAVEAISKSYVNHNQAGLRTFTESAIKLKYVQTTKSSMEQLEKSIGSVLKLDFDLSQANLWWFNASSNGLSDGLHTRYYQYREPLRRLYQSAADGKTYLKLFQSNIGAPKAAVAAAITVQQKRIEEILADIKWLEERGWKGQFKDQKLTAKSWLDDPSSALCGQALKRYLDAASKVNDDQLQFELYAEPVFIESIKICEVAQ